VGSSGSGEVATWVQYSRRAVRVDQVGRRTWFLKVAQVEAGMGRVEGVRVDEDVVVGVSGLVVEGVRREFRCVEMESSMLVRERRRKSANSGKSCEV
jgi:hypothetical protein